MADTQPADNPQYTFPPSPQPAPPSPQSFDDMLGTNTKQLTSDLTSIYEKKSKEESGLAYGEDKAIARREAEMERAHKQEAATINDLKPWNADEEMSKRSHSPMEEFGSFATIFSIAASAFTHTPATNAMNAAAAYMNAVNAGDAQSYNKAFEAFKENSELALKRANLEHQQFEEDNKLLDVDMTRWRAAKEASAAKFNDQKKLALLRNGMDPEVLQAEESFVKAKEGMAESFEKVSEAYLKLNYVSDKMKQKEAETGKPATPEDQMNFTREYEAKVASAKYAGRSTTTAGALQTEVQKRNDAWDAANPNASQEDKNEAHDQNMRDVITASKPVEDARAQETARHNKAAEALNTDKASTALARQQETARHDVEMEQIAKDKATGGLSGNKRDQLEAQIDGYNNALDDIKDLKSRIQKYHASVGIAGKMTRIGERLSDVLANSNESDRVQIMRDLERLKLTASRLLLDSQGRPLAASEHRIDDIIGGGSYGDTTVNSLRSLDSLADQYKKMLGQHQQRLDPKGAHVDIGTPSTTPPADDQPWLNDPPTR